MIYYKKKSLIKKVVNKIRRNREKIKFPVFSYLTCFIFLLFLVVIYSSYLFLLPKYLDSATIEKAINNFILKDSKLTLDIENFKINPNYKFDINLKADSIKIKYPNKEDFLVIKNPDIDVNLFSLVFGYVDLNKIKSNEIKLNVNFTKDKKYNCFTYFKFKDSKNKFKLRNLNVLADSFTFNLFDESVKKNFLVETDKIHILTSEYKKPIVITTKGLIKSSNHKISDFDLNLSVKLNEESAGKFKQKLVKLNYNPFLEADKYKFYTESKIDLKINPNDKKNNVVGIIALNNYTFELNSLKLPKNNLILNFKNNKITTNCDFKFLKEQYIKIKSVFALSGNYIEANLNSNELNLKDLNDIFATVGKIFNFKYDLNAIDVDGIANIDAYLKSDFKTINSNGKLLIKNAKISDKKTGLILKSINSDINFENNEIDILNTSAFVDSAKFNLKGKIDSKTNLNLKINSDEINIAQVLTLINELPFSNVIVPKLKDYQFKTGLLKINSEVLGNLNKPIINSKSSLVDLRFLIKKYNIDIYVPKIELKFLENDILIPNTKMVYENIPIFVNGKIKNYKTSQAEAILNVNSKLLKDNKILKLNEKDAQLNCAMNIKQNKANISSCDISNTIFVSGEVLNLDKESNLNLKVTFSENSSFILPQVQNLKIYPSGNIHITGSAQKPNVVGNLNLRNLQLDDIGLKVSDLILNIKNSQFYLNIANGKIFDFDFELVSNATFEEGKLIINSANVFSNYVNLENFEKYLKNSKTIKKLNYEINNIKANILTLETSDILLNSVSFEGDIKNDILNITKFAAETLNGSVEGNGSIDLLSQKTKIKLTLKELNIRQFSSKLKELSIAISGKLSALIEAEFLSFNLDNILNTFDGVIKFNIKNGELAQFAKLERFLQAGNILSQSIFKSNFASLAKQSTGDFKIIDGKVKIKNSIADIEYIKTQGSNMSLNIEGEFNLLNQNMNAKILGRIPNASTGFFDNFDKKDSMTSIEKRFSTYVSNDEVSKIPVLAYQIGEIETREFVVLIDGIVKNLNSIKEFKWIIK